MQENSIKIEKEREKEKKYEREESKKCNLTVFLKERLGTTIFSSLFSKMKKLDTEKEDEQTDKMVNIVNLQNYKDNQTKYRK